PTLSTRLEKPGRIRTESGLNEHLGRHETASGPFLFHLTPVLATQLGGRHTALHLAQHTHDRASVNRVFFIGISSFILPRKFYFRIRLRSGGITNALKTHYQRLVRCRAAGTKPEDDAPAPQHGWFVRNMQFH
ncbi:hypothetical protein J4729_23290, partial [Leisingera sp. HS039]|nr:hypothetical protein [Leisingera sp. HS039]